MHKLIVTTMVSLLTVLGSALCYAGVTPVYQPAPDWVIAPTPPEKIAAADDKLQSIISDNQIRIQNGTVFNYSELAQRVTSADALNKMGSIVLKWWPDHGDLIIHGVDIIRDGHRIDVLAQGQKFTVLRREANLEHLALDGLLTATLTVEGLRVGDILDFRVTSTSKDLTLSGNIATGSGLIVEPVRLGYGRVRALWPDGDAVTWKLYLAGVNPIETHNGEWHELNLTLPVPKPPDTAPAAPGRYAKPYAIEFSTFTDWASVSKVMAPLYVTQGLIQPGGLLNQEIQRIAHSSNDPRQRVVLSLQLVQDKVRYFLKAMDGGNYVPQTPEQTWTNRYGDCKAKTLLLLAVLHQLGIDAEPVFANLYNGDLIPERLPSVSAFNHVLVLAHLDHQDLYLDGTGLGATSENLDDVPALHWVLPANSNGGNLLKVPTRYPARPSIEFSATVDMRAGISFAAATKAKFTFRGPIAGMMNTSLTKLDKGGREKFLLGVLARTPLFSASTLPHFEFDESKATATITINGIFRQSWSRANDRYNFDPVGFAVPPPPDRSRSIWKDIPVAIPPSLYINGDMTFLLPDQGRAISLDGDQTRQIDLPGNRRYQYKVALNDGVLKVNFSQNQAGGEISAADIPDLRKKIAELTRHSLKVRTTTDYPLWWKRVAQSKRDHLYDDALTIYADAIAAKPDEAGRYLARAGFLISIFEREQAIADITKALNLQADKQIYLERAELYRELGQYDQAIQDMHAALDLDPVDANAVNSLSLLEAWTGHYESALNRMDAAIDNGGNQESMLVESKTEILFYAGKTGEATDVINAAIEKWPRNASLFNSRCWLRGIANIDLDAAQKDCAHAIELGEQIAPAALDSRAMIYYRQHNYTQAAADLKAALDERPALPGSLFLKAIVERELGNQLESAADLAGARMLNPRIDEQYARYGVKW